MLRSCSLVVAVAWFGLVSACHDAAAPPTAAADAAAAPASSASASASATASASASTPAAPAAAGVSAAVDAFAAALNDGDEAAAEKRSTPGCWQKECASLSKQAKKKLKVKPTGDIDQNGTHGVAIFDIVCQGGRVCDRVWLLLGRDCAHGGAWLVEDVTEKKSKPPAWLADAPPACR